MRVMVTGAAGFLGKLLVDHLLQLGILRGHKIDKLVLLDQKLDGFVHDSRLRLRDGSITDPTLLRRVLADGMDIVFHLAGVPGGAAEERYAHGRQVNLLASLELLDQLRNTSRPPVVVYASSVAVYGAELPARMDEQAALTPSMSYGAHKLMIETQLNDLSRRGEIDGRALRLPGVVARPSALDGLRSAFMSEVMHAVADGRAYQCPTSPDATAWWMSAKCCVENLIQAAELNTPLDSRCWQLPVLQLSVGQVVDALIEEFGEVRRGLISYQPDSELERLFGRFPVMRTPASRVLGFRHDGTAQTLVRNALNLGSRTRRPRPQQSA